MIPMERETIVMVATVIAVLGVIFLFREMNKSKRDIENLKNFSAHVIQKFNTPEQVRTPQPRTEPVPEPEKIAEEKVDE